MLKLSSQRFRSIFLLSFTNELIKNSLGEVDNLENVLDDEDKELKNKIKDYIKEHDESLSKNYLASKKIEEEFFNLDKPMFNLNPKSPMSQRPISKSPMLQRPIKRNLPRRVLRIPEIRLPSRLSYLKPIPTNIQVDLGKLNPLVNDPAVKVIQCNGPDQKISVSGSMGTKATSIILTREEINESIKKFADVSKIPIEEGVTRIVAGKLILLALVSKVVEPRFTIKKISAFTKPSMIR